MLVSRSLRMSASTSMSPDCFVEMDRPLDEILGSQVYLSDVGALVSLCRIDGVVEHSMLRSGFLLDDGQVEKSKQ